MDSRLTALDQPTAALVQIALKHLGFYQGSTKGLPGEQTDAAFARYLASLEAPPVKLATVSADVLREAFVAIARAEIGVREEGGNNRGRRVQVYQDAASYLPGTGWAWCAAFVGFCFDELAEKYALPFATPEGAGAFWYEDWARQQRLPVLAGGAKVLRGDLVIYSFSHIGIATTDQAANGTFLCVEGNTNGEGSREGDGVYEKRRGKAQIRSIIRPFPKAA